MSASCSPRDAQADVVILGSGVAGLATAVAAQRLGLTSLVLEKAPLIGGGTCFATGLIWVGCNHLARSQGLEDSAEWVSEYLNYLGGGQEDPRQLLVFAREAPRAVQFFEGSGVPFRLIRGMADHHFGRAPGAIAQGRTIEVDLADGAELGAWKTQIVTPKNKPYCMRAEELIATRGIDADAKMIADRTQRDLRGLGVGLITHLLRTALLSGVDVRLGQTVTEILMDGGRVCGVTLDDGTTVRVTRGVVIATGGYESNPAMVDSFEGLPGWCSYFPPSLRGDGLVLGSRIGGATRVIQHQMQLFLGFPVPVPGDEQTEFQLAGIVELCSPHTLVVNRYGQRFADESVFQRIGVRLRDFDVDRREWSNLPCFLVFDSQFMERYSFGGKPVGEIPAWVSRASSVERLAQSLGVDAGGLRATVERFNGFARSGRDCDFDRRGDPRFPHRPTLGELSKPPFFGIELRVAGSGSAGLLANEAAQVMSFENFPIAGLYVVGNAAAKTEIGVGYQAGLTLASGLTFGLLAAEHMVSRE